MTENKLKYMLEKNKLDNIINNKSEAEKLCKLETTEEVLDLLNKYSYNETKEVFERELLEILQISLSEEELNSVTGGRISHRQKLAALLGVISLTGSINIPIEAATEKKSISAVTKEKIGKKHGKNSKWMEAPKEDKLVKTLAGIVGVGGVGILLLCGGYKLLRPSSKPGTNQILEEEKIKEDESKDTHNDMFSGSPDPLDIMPTLTAPNEKWEGELAQINTIAVSLIQNPLQDYDKLVEKIGCGDLMTFALEGLKLWRENTKKYYNQELRSITDAEAWNANFGLLMKVRWAIWLLCLQDGKINAEDLQNHVQCRTYNKEEHSATFGSSNVWTERKDPINTKPLPNTVDYVTTIWPSNDDSIGNVKWTFWSINAALHEGGKLETYEAFDLQLEGTLDEHLPGWWETIPEPGDLPK